MSQKRTMNRVSGSFRDPAGYVFEHEGKIYRYVSQEYRVHYDSFMQKLYPQLLKKHLVLSHEETSSVPTAGAYKVLKPEHVPFISYPFEWSFSQLKDAALLTLEIQQHAIRSGLSLKDASARNIQFLRGRPILIDSLSFENWNEGTPWKAYGQFCRHFLAPLLLMAKVDLRLSSLLRVHLDGIPLDLCSKLLPGTTYFSFPTIVHIHLHSISEKRSARKQGGNQVLPRPTNVSKNALLGMIQSLRSCIAKLYCKKSRSTWNTYYENHNYSAEGMRSKNEIVSRFISRVEPQSAWDIGGNTGHFAQLLSKHTSNIVCFDIDPLVVEAAYQQLKSGTQNVLPLLLDICNPSPALGWSENELSSLQSRGPTHTLLALALVHHLVIANNIPLREVAKYFSKLCRFLVIEFVAKEDSQVQKLLRSREDIYPHYDKEHFEKAFLEYFTLSSMEHVEGSKRTLYLFETIQADK